MSTPINGRSSSFVLLVKRKFYTAIAKGQKLYIDVRYRNLIPVGSGSYGIVCSAIDTVNGMKVAIKISPLIQNNCREEIRSLREIKYLRFFNGCENVLNIVDYYCFPYRNTLRHCNSSEPSFIYMITPFYDFDLETVIDARNYLSFDQIRIISYQVLLALRYIHSVGFIHRDIKPANILINESADVAICDFGLARADLLNLTAYVVTRDYRAPELLVENKSYTNRIDIWSFGMVLAEMLNGQAFYRGLTTAGILDWILKAIGMPSEESLLMVEDVKVRDMIRRKRLLKKPLVEQFSRKAPDDAVKLVMSLLRFDPAKRPSANEAIHHIYFKDLVTTLQPKCCTETYDCSWEDESMRDDSCQKVQEEFVREQQYFPVVKCKYEDTT